MERVFLNPMETDTPVCMHVNEPTSLNEFLAQVQSKAYHVAYGALWDRETALDVVQESMMRLVEYYRERPPSQWPALFRTILNSKINDQRRKRLLASGKRKLISLTGLGLTDTEGDENMVEAELPSTPLDSGISDPEAGVSSVELKQKIESALSTLAERQRQVFLLRDQLGLSIRDTAETLGCSENSIKQHHFRALRAMRLKLSEVWDHEQT